MGFFDSISNAFNEAGKGFNNAFSNIKETFSSVGNGISGIISTGYQDGKKILETLHNDAVNIGGFYGNTTNKLIDSGTNIITTGENTIGDTLQGVAGSLTLPLAVGAGVLGLFLIMNNK